MALPESGYLSNATRTHGQMAAAFEAIRDAVAELQEASTALQPARHVLITTDDEWTVPAGITSLEILAIAGGGGGGSAGGSSGGGGYVNHTVAIQAVTQGDVLTIEIGTGGAGGAAASGATNGIAGESGAVLIRW